MPQDGKKIAVGLGIAAGIGALIYAATRVKAAPPGIVTVTLKNPPTGDYWQLLICNASRTDYRFIQAIPMDGEALFVDIPAWDFPLPFALQVYRWVEPSVSAEMVYSIQSYWGPEHYLEDFKDIYIPSFGDYFFNFATEQFEKV